MAATAARSLFSRAAIRAGSGRTTLGLAAARSQPFRQHQPSGQYQQGLARLYSSQPPSKPGPAAGSGASPPPPPPPAPHQSSSSSTWVYLLGATVLVGGGGAYWALSGGDPAASAAAAKGALKKGAPKEFKPTRADYQKVYDEIARLLVEKDDYDDGSYGPVLLRLAWHCSGTYDKESKTGGSNGATMRFAPEMDHGANAGLKAARDFLEPVKAKFPWITHSDLWILGGVCAVQEMQGPVIPYRPGRSDRDLSHCTPDGRLPDATKGSRHLRDIFFRMGLDDREIVALSGGHALGRCHADRSGFDGPWTFSPTVFTNDFFKLLTDEKWQWKKWNGPAQYEDKTTKSLMMLPTDLALVQDKAFKQYVDQYSKDNDLFFRDFAAALVKLFELGVPFPEGTERWVMKTSS